MPKYRLNYGDQFEFFAQTAGDVVPVLQERRMVGGSDDERFF